MTVIAWDGKTLAADKQSTNVGHASIVTKIFRVSDGLVGLAGGASHAIAMLEWFRSGREPSKWPRQSEGNSGDMVFIDRERRVFKYAGSETCHPEPDASPFFAMGCGRDYALAAMYLGCDARRAVEVACALDVFCGKGIDVLTLEAT